MSETNAETAAGGSTEPMPDAPVPDDERDAVTEAHEALVRAAAELRRLHGEFQRLHDTTRVLQEYVPALKEIIAQKDRTIAALQLTLKQERGRRLRPKAERKHA